MSDLCKLIWCALLGLFRSRVALEAEILVLRHQLNVLRRKSPKRLAFGNIDRLVFAGLYRVAPGALDALKILKPQTDGDPLAPRRLPSLLALAIKASRWPAEDVTRDPTAHSRHEHREPARGRTTDPRRTSQARHRCRANDGGQIYGNYQKPHPGLKRDEQHVGHLETHAHPA